ncbi:MAG TPA: valine--tRNA ligase [Candidatus Absconditabacterales bacterium]|nr:valine--tRNA ligase [Candidatus Absconditabacterales bacterium]HPK28001.1 valine--tRNA ligase [Candidatus Absconditabacterales bacterium]
MSKYNPKESEKKRQDFREENKIYTFDLNSDKEVFSIDTPPPTVSGKLHIGHISSYTQAEIIARYKRMKGYNVYYPMGFDNNGIPTELLVEKDLKINIKEMERKDFIQKCLEVNQKYVKIYESLRKTMGLSIDWTKIYSTIDPKTQQIVQKEFVKLYKQGHIVAKEFPALRCTKLQATIAQAETEDQEFEEYFNDIEFTLEDGTKLTIATTRPELLPACKAVFAHPDDTRYQKYFNKKITTPLGDTVPLLPDDKAKIDKGTGLVMCCSYGDETDVYWFQKHGLEAKICIDRYGKMQNTGLTEINGLKVNEARDKIMDILEQKGVVKNRTKIVQSKSISERGKVPVEIIPVHQRFVNILDKKDILLEQNDKMRWFPEFMKKRSNDWIENLHRDWNISRNRKFGIPIPVWYDINSGDVILPSMEQLEKGPVDPSVDLPDGYTKEQVRGETLVLDTWFTSGLSPLINKNLLDKNGFDTKDFFPMSMRPQSHDIIRTWLLYTTLHSYLRDGKIPFQNIMISGFVMAEKGQKFSKSKGNAFDPEDLINQRGADAIRYWTAGSQLGKDILFEENEIKNGQKLITKLWNASNFVQMLTQGFDPKQKFDTNKLLATDQRIIARTNETIEKMTKYLDNYEYGLAKIAFEEFFWADFCDNYLELVKLRLYKPELFENGEEKKLAGQWTLYHILFDTLKLIAPYLPHITEEIYQNYFKQYENIISIHKTEFPTQILEINNQAEQIKEFEKIKEIIESVRKFKTENQISMGAELKSLDIHGSKEFLEIARKYLDDIIGVTKAQKVDLIESHEENFICSKL